MRVVRILNDLYGSNKMYAFEFTKGYSNPLSPNQKLVPVDEAQRKAHDQLVAKQKLTLILRSNVYVSRSYKRGDMVQIFSKIEKTRKMGPAPTSIVNRLRCWFCHGTKTSWKDIDELDGNINSEVEDNDVTESTVESEKNSNKKGCGEPPSDIEMTSGAINQKSLPEEGDRSSVYWPFEPQFHSGTANSVKPGWNRASFYDEDDIEPLNHKEEEWCYENTASGCSQDLD